MQRAPCVHSRSPFSSPRPPLFLLDPPPLSIPTSPPRIFIFIVDRSQGTWRALTTPLPSPSRQSAGPRPAILVHAEAARPFPVLVFRRTSVTLRLCGWHGWWRVSVPGEAETVVGQWNEQGESVECARSVFPENFSRILPG